LELSELAEEEEAGPNTVLDMEVASNGQLLRVLVGNPPDWHVPSKELLTDITSVHPDWVSIPQQRFVHQLVATYSWFNF
jgi:hypothetical protein